MTNLYRPLRSLREGRWFKLICGASFQHLPAVRSLTLAYALAGADCIDVAADPAVIAAAQDGLRMARQLIDEAQARGYEVEGSPWLMVSLNDGEDPHFRKAEFDAGLCPESCPRPCVAVCPVKAIVFDADGLDGGRPDAWANTQVNIQANSQPGGESRNEFAAASFSGVIESLCYGCGRCLTICPVENITARAYVSTPAAVAPLVLTGVDAVEIHTQIGRLEHFRRLWQAILPYRDQLKLISISCPDGEGLIDYLWSLYDLMAPLSCALIWQTDGRPMSGDIGDGATRAAIRLGQKVLAAGLPGYVQLAGGTNHHTVAKLKAMGLFNPQIQQPAPTLNLNPQSERLEANPGLNLEPPQPYIAGVAYGSYARAILSPILDRLEPALELSIRSAQSGPPQPVQSPVDLAPCSTMLNPMPLSKFKVQPDPAVSALQLEDNLQMLWQAVAMAHRLVADLKLPKAGSSPALIPLSDSITASQSTAFKPLN
ncbi:MAG: LdpA C-terminal domain-containing domain [Elainella sp.]